MSSSSPQKFNKSLIQNELQDIEILLLQLAESKKRRHLFSKQMRKSMCKVLHHHFLLNNLQTQTLYEYLSFFIQSANDDAIQQCILAIQAFACKQRISKRVNDLLGQKYKGSNDRNSIKSIKMSEFYQQNKQAKQSLVYQVDCILSLPDLQQFDVKKDEKKFKFKCQLIQQILLRISMDSDAMELIFKDITDFDTFFNRYVGPLVTHSMLIKNSYVRDIIKRILKKCYCLSGKNTSQIDELSALLEEHQNQAKVIKPNNASKQTKQQQPKKQQKKSQAKKKQQQQQKQLSPMNINQTINKIYKQMSKLSKKQLVIKLLQQFGESYNEPTSQAIFQYFQNKTSGKISLREAKQLKFLFRGFKNIGILHAAQQIAIKSRLKNFTDKKVEIKSLKGAKQMGRVNAKIQKRASMDFQNCMYLPKFIIMLEDELMHNFQKTISHRAEWQRVNQMALKRVQSCILTQMSNRRNQLNYQKLVPFGSSVNGFHTNNSDIDVSIRCHLKSMDGSLINYERKFLNDLAFVIRDQAVSSEIQVITSAKVPIIRFTEKMTGVSFDLSCNNQLGYINSQLINAYRRYDQRFHILGINLKLILKQYDLVGPGKGLSSYAYLLMLIAFLQSGVQKPSILPNLQNDKYRDKKSETVLICLGDDYLGMNISNLRILYLHKIYNMFKSKSQKLMMEKLISNLCRSFFFSSFISTRSTLRQGIKKKQSELQHNQTKISIKDGGYIQRAIDDKNFLFSIADPFDSFNNPGKLVKAQTAQADRLLEAFTKIMKRIRENRPIYFLKK